jgi:hypothetical protein
MITSSDCLSILSDVLCFILFISLDRLIMKRKTIFAMIALMGTISDIQKPNSCSPNRREVMKARNDGRSRSRRCGIIR